MDKQRDFVLRTIEERGVKFVRLWFTDVVGTLKSVAIAPAEVEGAFTEGIGFDGSAIEGLSRSFESDLLAYPDPTTFQTLPWRGDIDPDGAHVLRHHHARRGARRRRPAQRAQAHARTGGGSGLHVLHAPRDRVLPAAFVEVRRGGAGAGRLRRLLRQRARRHRARFPPPQRAHARRPGHLGGVQPPRGGARPERDRPALRRRPHDGRQHHDVPHGDQGGGDRAGRVRDLHAEAVLAVSRQRHAHPPVAVRRATRTPSTRRARSTSCRRSAASSSPASSGTPTRSRRSRTSS